MRPYIIWTIGGQPRLATPQCLRNVHASISFYHISPKMFACPFNIFDKSYTPVTWTYTKLGSIGLDKINDSHYSRLFKINNREKFRVIYSYPSPPHFFK